MIGLGALCAFAQFGTEMRCMHASPQVIRAYKNALNQKPCLWHDRHLRAGGQRPSGADIRLGCSSMPFHMY